jgi:hypothetical protein
MIKSIRIVLELLIYIPIKILQVSIQYLSASIFGTVKSASLLPKISKEEIKKPYIEYESNNDFFRGMIAISPIFYLGLLYYILDTSKILTIYTLQQYLFIAVNIKALLFINLWKSLLGYYLLFASIPTIDDLKKFGVGMISPNGFIFLLICSIITFVILKNGGL